MVSKNPISTVSSQNAENKAKIPALLNSGEMTESPQASTGQNDDAQEFSLKDPQPLSEHAIVNDKILVGCITDPTCLTSLSIFGNTDVTSQGSSSNLKRQNEDKSSDNDRPCKIYGFRLPETLEMN